MTITRRALALLPLAAPALAQGVADRPLRAIVPFSPGGTTDLVARLVAEAVGQVLGQPVVIENRTGAGVVVGSDVVAKAAPDGGIVLITSSAHSVAPALMARLPYDPVADFAGIAHLGAVPQVVVVNPRAPAEDLAGLLALLRAAPGRHAFSSGGMGSAIHLATETFMAATGTQMVHVPYRGGGQAMQAVITGETLMMIDPVASAASHIRGGSVRAVALGAGQRSPILPEVPTAAEAGLPGWRAEAWLAVLAPARIPPAQQARLAEAFAAGLARIAPRMAALGVLPPPPLDPAGLMALVRADMDSAGAVLRAAGVKPE